MALDIEEESAVAPQGDGSISTVLNASGDGKINLAGRDVNVYEYYYDRDGTKIDIVSTLQAIPNLRKIHLDVLSKATPKTGLWFLEWTWFLLWLDPNGDLRILWGTGIPGAGKSVLASIVIQNLETRAEAARGNICVAYVYFRYSESANLTVGDILAILVKQTVERHADCASLANEVYAQHLLEDTEPTEADLLQLLHQFTALKVITFYILEALDEAPERVQLDVVQKLSTHELERNSHLQRLLSMTRNKSLKDEIASSIKGKCGGMFLHASLQLDALSRCNSAYDVKHTLEVFPAQIEDVYVQTWKRIQKQVPEHAFLAKAVLVWILNAPRPMKLEELECAVATCPNTYKFNPDRVVPGETLMALCQGLVTFEEKSRLVRLVHYTAQEPLRRLLYESYPYPHPHLSAVCITHLIHQSFQKSTVPSWEKLVEAFNADPLLAYAFDAWAAHAQEIVAIDGINHQVIEFIHNCSAFPVILGTLHGRAIFDIFGPFHILALHNFPRTLFKSELIGDATLPTKMQQLSPLMIACLQGHYTLVQDFLRLDQTSVNAVDKQGWSALIYAAAFGHKDIVSILLEHPEIMVNLVNSNGDSALMAAAAHGHEGVVALLLKFRGIKVFTVNNIGMSALALASANGREWIVALLITTPGIDVNLVANNGRSALFWAAANGHERVASLLLQQTGIDVNLVAKNKGTALMAAAANGHAGIVKLLLQHPGIKVHIVNNIGMSALMFAAANGHEGVVRLLLTCPGIQVNQARDDGMSALLGAANYGHEGTVALLVAHPGVNVNPVRNDGVSALMIAADWGHEGVVRILLNAPGIDISIQTTEGSHTALSVASRHGRNDIVHLFREFESRRRAFGRFVANGFERRQMVASRVGIREHAGFCLPLSLFAMPPAMSNAESST